MRAKDALAAENAMILKTSEKQLKAIDVLTEARTALLDQLVRSVSSLACQASSALQTALEKEVTLQSDAKTDYQKRHSELELQVEGLRVCQSGHEEQIGILQSALSDRTATLEAEQFNKQRLLETLGRLERQLQQQADRAAQAAMAAPRALPNGAGHGGGGKVEELEKFNEDLTVGWAFGMKRKLMREAENAQVHQLPDSL